MRHGARWVRPVVTACVFCAACQGQIKTVIERNDTEAATPSFRFKTIPQPSQSDAATKATFTVVDGNDGLNLRPRRGTDPQTCGWRLIADVDARPGPGETGGGQYAVSISGPNDTIGRFQYLLFDVSPTERTDPFGNTFFSEIDVVDRLSAATPVTSAVEPDRTPRREIVEADGGTYQISIDTTETPDLADWVHKELAPVVQQWYPRLVTMLAQARHDGNYRISANFLNWVTKTCNKDLVGKLNTAAREGRYAEGLWPQLTGHTVQELGDQWKASLGKAATSD